MNSSGKLLVIDVAALGHELVTRHPPKSTAFSFSEMDPVFPALTCTAQAGFRTGRLPGRHGMVANGVYARDLKKPLFWEQSAALVEGPRIWDRFREQGGTVGMMFWQQSLGEPVELLLSPKPVHKHGGGMWQDVYSRPDALYDRLAEQVGRPFNLMHYWGPLASRKSSDWIVDATLAVLESGDQAPGLLLTYLPHLDYDQQRYGPDSEKGRRALELVYDYLERLVRSAQRQGYEFLVFGDYAIRPAHHGACFPNRALRDAGLFNVRKVRGRAYPDFFSSPAFAMVDHEVAHVYTTDKDSATRIGELLQNLEGVGTVLDWNARMERGIEHANSGDLVLVAEEGWWFAYPWWSDPGEAPDFAGHVDIHNKPGYDPCELFFGWPPPRVSLDPGRIKGTHGAAGPGREIAWASSLDLDPAPTNLAELGGAVEHWLSK
jgi:predicted AlkP superfamily pyrophosphatase or phosphodiesterase